MNRRLCEEYELLAAVSEKAQEESDCRLYGGKRKHVSRRHLNPRFYQLESRLIVYSVSRFLQGLDLGYMLSGTDVGILLPDQKDFVPILEGSTSLQRVRLSRRCGSAFLLLGLSLVAIPLILLSSVLWYGGTPPSYAPLRVKERALPQHRLWGSWTVGKDSDERLGEVRSPDWRSQQNRSVASLEAERYLRFPDHLWGHGLNNVLQEAYVQLPLRSSTFRFYVTIISPIKR